MEKTKKKLLYIMGIDWNWIYQRPHILEQHLEKSYDVTVVFPRSIMKFFLNNKNEKKKHPDKYRILWTLPLQERFRLIGLLSRFISRNTFRNLQEYDAVMIGYPLYYRYIPSGFTGKIIYDCMDNYTAMFTDPTHLHSLTKQERLLANDCDLLIVSGNKLREAMRKTIRNQEKITLIRNGTDYGAIRYTAKSIRKDVYKIGYFGTIAPWFNYHLLQKSLDAFQDIEYHLIGPQHNKLNNSDPRIIWEGVVEHSRLPEYVRDYDCLIMPFHVDHVVEWVDPVKLYEYIALGKCIISVYYQEIDRFKDYVYFYDNEEEYMKLLYSLKQDGFPPKFTQTQQRDFLYQNSWNERCKKLDAAIHQLLIRIEA